MHATRSVNLTGVLLAVLLAGCLGDGGRGSSGFDITENLLINQVLETQECFRNDDLTFCPADQQSGTPTPTPTAATPPAALTPTATPTVEAAPHVNTGLASGALVVCTRQQPGAPCDLTFSFSANGFPAEASFYVAARLRTPDTGWTLAALPARSTSAGSPMLDAAVRLPVPANAADPRAQFAVLIFLTAPASIPERFDVLAQSGTDFAFVTAEFALEVITIGPPPTATDTPTEVEATASPTPSAATPTATAPAPHVGPEITYFGVARADSVSLAPSGFDADGRPIYIRPFGFGLSLIVEGRPGPSRLPVGRSAYAAAGGLPDLQMILSRAIGDGSDVVCDRLPPRAGGVPATSPFAFSDAVPVVNAINDLGCRVDDGQGNPSARASFDACTLNRDGEFTFVDATTTAQFCLPIAGAWAFQAGDTVARARLRDGAGNLGPAREIIVRNAAISDTSPTPTGAIVPTPTRPPATPFTPTAPTQPVTPSGTAGRSSTPTAEPTGSLPPMSPSSTPPVSPTPTPTSTPFADDGPIITHLGLARADDRPMTPVGDDAQGRPIYSPRLGQGLVLLVEARPGASGRRVGSLGYDPGGLADLQVILSQPLGDGNPAVCDTRPPLLGGVAATVPLVFSGDPAVVAAISDLGCRVNDGAGQPIGRQSEHVACTTAEGTSSGFGFVGAGTSMQFCIPIARAWAFPVGDTVVVARVRDVGGRTGAARAMVVRVRHP
jgi:hypothetical protein